MSIHYYITDDSHYTSNGCDCCEPTKWENYNCDLWMHSASSIEEALVLTIQNYLEDIDPRELSKDTLENIMRELGITYEIS